MCLHKITSKKAVKDTVTKDGLKVYKIVEIQDNKCFAAFRYNGIPYKEGINIARTTIKISTKDSKYYQSGFHFFKTKEEAKDRLEHTPLNNNLKVIICTIKKSWITAVGVEKYYGTDSHEKIVIVAKKAIFPKFSEKNE